MKKILLAVMCVLMISTFCGCRKFAEYSEDDVYASEVRQLVDDSVKYTRIWQEYDRDFTCYDTQTAKEYMSALEEIEKICKKLLSLMPSEKFEYNDESVKRSAGELLSVTSEIKDHIKYAVETEDDILFQKEKNHLFALYMEYYEDLTDASQYLQTFWRNA